MDIASSGYLPLKSKGPLQGESGSQDGAELESLIPIILFSFSSSCFLRPSLDMCTRLPLNFQ